MTEKMYVASSEDYGRDEQSAMVGTNYYLFHFSECCFAVLATRLFFYQFFFQVARFYIVDTLIKWLVEMLC